MPALKNCQLGQTSPSLHTCPPLAQNCSYAALEAFHIVVSLFKDVHFFDDSQATMYALQSICPMDCYLVRSLISHDLIHALEGAADVRVHFTWVPSHVGILFNEKADRIAQ